MFEIPNNILEFFLNVIDTWGKYKTIIHGNGAILKPRDEDDYYKPVVIIEDFDVLKESLINYVESLNSFFVEHNNLQEYHDLGYFFRNLFLNMTISDALDLSKYIDRRSFYFTNNQFSEYDKNQVIANFENGKIYVQRKLESPGLETPFILLFILEINGHFYDLPLIRYAFDENNICHIYAIQYGKDRQCNNKNNEFSSIINKINSGIKKHRNVSPSFVVVFSLFLKILRSYEIDKIVIPDYLFGRYKHYYHNQGTKKSNDVLSRILDKFLILLQRMEYQFDFFTIENFPNEIDSYTHVKLNYIKK